MIDGGERQDLGGSDATLVYDVQVIVREASGTPEVIYYQQNP